MECLGNFLVKVSIDLKCFGLEYPGKAVTDLQISAVDSDDADNSNTCLAFSDGDSEKNHLYRYDFYTKETYFQVYIKDSGPQLLLCAQHFF